MKCATCGSVGLTKDGCAVCGAAPVALDCAACGAHLLPDSRFCSQCGGAVIGGSGASFAILRSSVPAYIAERILRQGVRMAGERRRVTVLFADIKGSTETTRDMDPEDAMAMIGTVMKILMDTVHAYNGFVNATRGDGIMALFGAPLTNEGHAIDACAAALAMRKEVAQRSGFPRAEAALRIGLNSGEVIIQSIGSDLSMNYDAVGPTVHLAARMETAARPGTILITESTRALAKGQMRTETRGPLEIRGLPDPIPAFELIEATPLTRWQARKSFGLSAFTGRARDLDILKNAVASVERGHGRIVSVIAPAGFGKSRLIHELVASLPARWDVLEAACSPHQTTSSYHPIAQVMRVQLGIAPTDKEDVIEARLRERMEFRDPALAVHVPAFLSLLDVRSGDKGWARLDPVERRIKVVEALRANLTARAATRFVLAIIEDAHWADPETNFILETIAGQIEGMRALILLTQRPEGGPRLPETTARLTLGPLDDRESEDLAGALLGDDIGLVPLRQRILQLAQGNPLFIEELVQDLKERGHLVGVRGNYRLLGTLDALRLPDSIQSVIAARIDQLDGQRKSVLQTAAVAGRQVPVALLAHMLGRAPEDVAPILVRLEEGDFLHREHDDSTDSYVFKHELTREVAYRTLLIGTRRVLHAKAVDYIEATFAERLEEHIDRLADHAFEAQLWAKALPYQMRSCRRALRRGANHEAIAICERAQAALKHVPESADRTKAEIDFALASIIALEPIGRHRQIASILRAAGKTAQALGDPWRLAAVNCQLVVALWRIGEHPAAMQAATSAELAAKGIGDTDLMFAARHILGIVHHETGNFAAAIQAFRACLAMETPDIDVKRVGWAALPSVVLRTFLADSLFEIGEFDEARRIADEGAARAERAGHAYSRVQVNQVRARVMVAQGQARDALAMLAADWQSSIELDMVQMHPIIAARLGEAHLAAGNIGAALDILAQPDRLDVPFTENAFGWRYLFVARGQAFLRSGRHEDALACAKRALALATERSERPQAAYAHALLGEIALTEPRGYRSAQKHLREAVKLAESCGMHPLATRCRGLTASEASLFERLRAWLALFGI